MRRKKSNSDTIKVLLAGVAGIEEKKGNNVVALNFSEIKNSICDYFLICHGTSKTQVDALADAIQDAIFKVENVHPYHVEGYENCEWILLDYIDVVIHVFLDERRDFYKLEKLWGDAAIVNLEELRTKSETEKK